MINAASSVYLSLFIERIRTNANTSAINPPTQTTFVMSVREDSYIKTRLNLLGNLLKS